MLPVTEIDVPRSELRFHHASGRLSLDLVATIGERWRRRFERLREPGDLARWLDAVGLSPAVDVDDDDLIAFRRLRAAIEALATAAMAHRPYPERALAVVNRFAAVPAPTPRLQAGTAVSDVADAAAAASAVARDAIELFGGPVALRVRECAADDCALVFVDASRSGNRRWCSMRACGNRQKVARHRAVRGPSPASR